MGNANDPTSNEVYADRAIVVAARLAFLALLVVWCFQIVQPFIMLILWGIIIAVGIYPIHRRISSWLGNRAKLSAILLSLLGVALLIVPSLIFAGAAIDETQALAGRLEA